MVDVNTPPTSIGSGTDIGGALALWNMRSWRAVAYKAMDKVSHTLFHAPLMLANLEMHSSHHKKPICKALL